MVLIINHAELAWSHALYELLCMDNERAVARAFQCGAMIFGRVANLEAHVNLGFALPWVESEEMEIVNGEMLLVGCARLKAFAHIKDVALHVLLHRIPGPAAEAKAVALADGVEPQTLVLANLLAGL